jgi:hypothetical protein
MIADLRNMRFSIEGTHSNCHCTLRGYIGYKIKQQPSRQPRNDDVPVLVLEQNISLCLLLQGLKLFWMKLLYAMSRDRAEGADEERSHRSTSWWRASGVGLSLKPSRVSPHSSFFGPQGFYGHDAAI